MNNNLKILEYISQYYSLDKVTLVFQLMEEFKVSFNSACNCIKFWEFKNNKKE